VCSRWWAEKEVGLENVLEALNRHAAANPKQQWLRPSSLLVEAVNNKASIAATLAAHRKKV
jgi:hypothetical protein